jgi:hypothetical protein
VLCSVDRQRRHWGRAGREPALAVVRNHDRLVFQLMRVKELPDQAADRSAAAREEDERACRVGADSSGSVTAFHASPLYAV